MKTIFLVLFSLCIFTTSNGQRRYQGFLYTLQTDSREPFLYSVRTSTVGEGIYQTKYSLYDNGGKVRYTITADHFKEEKKVVVQVYDERFLLTVMNGKDETTYEVPSLKPFGFRGNVGIFDKAAPNQLSVQFVSNKYNFVRILNFLGSYEDNIFQFFIFKSTDKIAEPEIISNNYRGDDGKPKAIFRPRPSDVDSIMLDSWFTGTKKFCEDTDSWYYLVTIKGDSIDLKSYPGKSNNYHKDKTKAFESVRGVIRDGKIVTDRDNFEYKNLFKYENGVLYQLNEEDEYNEYTECES
jgi:hypothetical protein